MPAVEARCHCWGEPGEEEQTAIGISLSIRALRGRGASDAGYGWQEATCSGYGRLGHFLCRLQVARQLLCGLRSAGGQMQCGSSCTIYRQQGWTMVVISEARRRHGLPPLGARGPSHHRSLQKKKGGHCNQETHVIALTFWEHTGPAAATAK